MKLFKVSLFVILLAFSFPIMAQNKSKDNNDIAHAKVEVVKGQKALVLKTGRKTKSSSWGTSNSADIVLKLDDKTWMVLDSLVISPWGSSVKVKDLDGYNVDIAKANVNSKVGLMFTSGTKCVAITEEELKQLRN